MENYYYVNIFEAKGWENVLVICYILILIFFIKYFFGQKKKGADDNE